MKKISTLIMLMLLYMSTKAQLTCGFDAGLQSLRQSDSINYAYLMKQLGNEVSRFRAKQTSQSTLKTAQSLTAGCKLTRYIIPVVVHVVHQSSDSVIGMGANISDSQIYNAIAKLNRWFLKEDSASPKATNTLIQFCLAFNRSGGAITRHTSNSLARPRFPTDDSALKQLSVANTDSFLNIWLVKDILDQNGTPSNIGGWGWPYFMNRIQGVVLVSSRMGDYATCHLNWLTKLVTIWDCYTHFKMDVLEEVIV
jgi:hypothetical protein